MRSGGGDPRGSAAGEVVFEEAAEDAGGEGRERVDRDLGVLDVAFDSEGDGEEAFVAA